MDLERVVGNLIRPAALAELAALALCLGGAWVAVRLLRPAAAAGADSIWYGERGVDGVLFPLLALGFAHVAGWLFARWVPPAVFRLAEPVLVSLLVIRIVVRVLGATFPRSPTRQATERTVTLLAWGAVLLWFLGVLGPLVDALADLRWKVGGTTMSVLGLVEIVLATAGVLVGSLWVSAVVERRLLRHADSGDLSVRKMAANLVRSLLLFVGLMLVLPAVGVDLTALSVLSGAVGVGLGFGLQKIASNYISGFVILGERSLRIGDMVKVDNFEGRISDIRTRYTMVRAANGREAIVPNEMLITQRVENLSRVNADLKLALTAELHVAYGTDVQALLPALEAAMRGVARVLQEPAPSAEISGLSDQGLVLALSFWIGDPSNGQGNVRSAVILAALQVLRSLGVEIPYPQRVLHRGAPSPQHGAPTNPGGPS